jgi:hypothetical protein
VDRLGLDRQVKTIIETLKLVESEPSNKPFFTLSKTIKSVESAVKQALLTFAMGLQTDKEGAVESLRKLKGYLEETKKKVYFKGALFSKIDPNYRALNILGQKVQTALSIQEAKRKAPLLRAQLVQDLKRGKTLDLQEVKEIVSVHNQAKELELLRYLLLRLSDSSVRYQTLWELNKITDQQNYFLRELTPEEKKICDSELCT